jgi:vacuolar-type H+-ATPase subunit I/STV1
MSHKNSVIVACLSASMLSACQTAPQKSVEKPVETQASESDLIMMPGKASGSKANSSYQLKAMTLEELRGCAQSLFDINKASTALKAKNAGLEKRKATLSEAEQSLIERRLKIDTHNAKLVKEFNQEGNKYMEAVKQLQVDINEYNNQVNKSNQGSNAYTTNCNNRAYKASDLHQLAPNLIEVMQNNSESLDMPMFENTLSGNERNSTTNGGNNSSIHLPGSSRK